MLNKKSIYLPVIAYGGSCRAEFAMSCSGLFVKTIQNHPNLSIQSTGIFFESLAMGLSERYGGQHGTFTPNSDITVIYLFDYSKAKDISYLFGYLFQDSWNGIIFREGNRIIDLDILKNTKAHDLEGLLFIPLFVVGLYDTIIKNIESLNLSQAKNINYIFYGQPQNYSQALYDHLIESDTSNITNINGLFSFIDLTDINLSHLETGHISSMSHLFAESTGKTNNEKLNFLTNLNTHNLKSLRGIFNGIDLTGFDLESIETGEITEISDTFGGSTGLTQGEKIDYIIRLNTSKVKSMRGLFAGYDLTGYDLVNLETNSVTNMSRMFSNANLTGADLSNLNTENVTDMSSMFAGSTASNLDLSSFNTSKVTNMDLIFNNVSGLTSLDLNGWDINNAIDPSSPFSDTNSLIVYCDQGGSPGTGSIWGETCQIAP